MKKAWWKESVVYQIYPRSFMDSNGDGIGDLNGIRMKLPYLKELGIDVIWLSPIYRSPNDDNGYDISDYRAIMKEFGSMEDFDALLMKAHELGLRIVMDLVVNHTSDEHPWFVQSRASRENSRRDFYIWREGGNGMPPNNWGSVFGGSAWEYDENTGMYYLHLFSKKQPDLNWENPAVRDAVFDMMTWWCDKGIDGFRMDVINLISKAPGLPDGETNGGTYGNPFPFCANGPRVHDFLREMNQRVLSRYDLMTVGETGDVTPKLAKLYAGENRQELNMVFQFQHVELGDGPFGKWTEDRVSLTELKDVLSDWQRSLSGKAWNSLFWDNHDQPRCVSRFGNDGAYRVESSEMLAACLHMMQGTPYIYQGEELGMTNGDFTDIRDYRDIESINAYRDLSGVMGEERMLRCLRARSRDNARTPMQWDDSPNAGFSTARPWIKVNSNYKEINAASQIGDPDSVFSFYKKLIRLRKKYPVIVYGSYELFYPESETLFVYKRSLERERLLCICSFSEKEEPFTFPEEFRGDCGELLISNYKEGDYGDAITLRPYEARVYYKMVNADPSAP